ncbi:hypothetical protein [Flavobacterium sp.]|uniref:hypothetical protein n=1 Tax=Flavobacterium sp. TaxID=239 RepID=UPI0040478A00
MKKIAFILFLVFSILSCKRKITITQEKNPAPIIENLEINDTIEVFVDSINFGKKFENKLEIYKVGENLMTFTKIYLSDKINGKWVIKDSLLIECERINNLNVLINDFNNDNNNDLLFTSGTAARGANNIQTLVLFSENQKLKWIKNSDNFPNLMYNEKLDCIDALAFTGGLTTVFLKIQNDSLIQFASVDQRDNRISVEVLDNNGKWKEINNIIDKSKEMKRFINYNPLEERE